MRHLLTVLLFVLLLSPTVFAERIFKAPDLGLEPIKKVEKVEEEKQTLIKKEKPKVDKSVNLPETKTKVEEKPSKMVIPWEDPNYNSRSSSPLREEVPRPKQQPIREQAPMQMETMPNTGCVDGQCDQNFSYPTRQRSGFFRRLFR